MPTLATPPPGVAVDRRDLIDLRHAAKGLTLAPRRQAASLLAGGHRSRLRGRGMDYLESRHYQPGDDVRSMDWRLTARTGAPHVKLYIEERERPVIVLVDLSPRMHFATRGAFKSVIAARAAALLGWTATAQGDRLGALLLTDTHEELEPRGGRRGILTLIDALARGDRSPSTESRAAVTTPLDAALERLRHVARPGSLLALISDFLELGTEAERHLLALKRHNDLLAIQVSDPIERQAPPAGIYGISDGTRRALLDLTTDRARNRFEAYFGERRARSGMLFAKLSLPVIALNTADETVEVLRSALEHRQSHRRGA